MSGMSWVEGALRCNSSADSMILKEDILERKQTFTPRLTPVYAY